MIRQTASGCIALFLRWKLGGDPRRWTTAASCKQSSPPTGKRSDDTSKRWWWVHSSSPLPLFPFLSHPRKFSRSWNITITDRPFYQISITADWRGRCWKCLSRNAGAGLVIANADRFDRYWTDTSLEESGRKEFCSKIFPFIANWYQTISRKSIAETLHFRKRELSIVCKSKKISYKPQHIVHSL